MSSRVYYYQFAEQKVFATEHAPVSFTIKGNYVIIAMDNYTVIVYDITNNLNLVNSFTVCGYVIKIDYCVLDDYMITMETKDNVDTGTSGSYSIRTYHNWRMSGENHKMKFRAALRATSTQLSSEKVFVGDTSFRESAIEVLEFLHLSRPQSFSIYTNPSFRRSFSINKHNQNYIDLSSTVAVSENTCVHFYRLYQSLSQVLPKRNSKLEPDVPQDFSFSFKHLYTINFNFIISHVCIFENILAAASKDKVQIIRILGEKENCEIFSEKLVIQKSETVSSINLEIEKCWLTSVSNERKMVSSKQRMRPKEILGPTHDLDTASITLLRYADSKEMSFETLLFRKYNIPTEDQEIQNIYLQKIADFEEYGFLIVKKHEIVHYSFCEKRNEVVKLAEYDFNNEFVIGATFSDNVNLLHVAFANGNLVTYNSRLCARGLFHCDNIYKKISLTKFGKVTLMGLTDVKSCGLFVLAYCKFNFTEIQDNINAVVLSSDSWNFYLFSQPPKEQLKKEIVANADHKGSKKLLQMLLCSFLVFPFKEELNITLIEEIIICCLKSESFYSEIVPSLLSSSNLQISDVLKIFQTLETKELFNKHLFKLYATKSLINGDFSRLTEDQFRWIIIKVLDISVTLLFDIIVTNNLEKFLKADLFTIEGLESDSFESIFLKMLYFSAHGDFDIAEPFVFQLDENELKNVLKSQFQLLYYEKNHTSFGWLINLSNPQMYAEVMASCFLNSVEQNNGFTNLEVTKQVGQCAYILVLEELLNICLKETGNISDSKTLIQNERQFTRKSSSSVAVPVTKYDAKQYKVTADTCKPYVNQLLLLYHEFSFNPIEFCPHKMNNLCRKIPFWLKSFRYNSILNMLPPFNGIDPYSFLHSAVTKPCLGLCCQSYLVRLQCLLSWPQSSLFINTNIIEASCESNNHPFWKSLQFLLLQMKPIENRNPLEIINFLNTAETHNDNRLVETYLSSFGKEISGSDWENIIRNKLSNFPLDKLLKCVSSIVNLNQLISILNSLKNSESISESEYNNWVEKSGRLHNRETLVKMYFKQLLEENN